MADTLISPPWVVASLTALMTRRPSVNPASVAFVLDATNAAVGDDLIEIVFLGLEDREVGAASCGTEDGLVPRFVALDHLARVDIRPPIGGRIRAIHVHPRRTAAYLGNVWRPGPVTARPAW